MNFLQHSSSILIKNVFSKHGACFFLGNRKLFSVKSPTMSVKNEEKTMMSSTSESHIVWVDLEMTGLNIDTDHIIEMACLVTDKDLNIVAEGPNLVIKQSDHLLDTMDDWCQKTHGESGLTAAVRASQVNIQQAEQQMLEFVSKHVPPGKCPLAGNSVHVDRIFLNKHMKNFLAYLSYRIIDVSSVKELAKRWYSPELAYFKKKNPHRALDDIKESIEELKNYRSKIFK